MTAADRPSVTDNARTEAERRYPSDVADRGLTYPTGAVREHSQAAFVAGAEWAAGRAETTTATPPTTATDEDAARRLYNALRRAWPEGYADPEDVEDWSYWEEIARDAGLLATARTRPTLAEISLRLALEMDCERVYDDNANAYYCNEHDVGWLSDTNQCARAERLADAVLALFDEEADRG